MGFADAVKLLMVSFDSTVKANLSVGLPLDLALYEIGSLRLGRPHRIEVNDPQYRAMSDGWADALRVAFKQLPDVDLQTLDPAGDEARPG